MGSTLLAAPVTVTAPLSAALTWIWQWRRLGIKDDPGGSSAGVARRVGRRKIVGIFPFHQGYALTEVQRRVERQGGAIKAQARSFTETAREGKTRLIGDCRAAGEVEGDHRRLGIDTERDPRRCRLVAGQILDRRGQRVLPIREHGARHTIGGAQGEGAIDAQRRVIVE